MGDPFQETSEDFPYLPASGTLWSKEFLTDSIIKLVKHLPIRIVHFFGGLTTELASI